MISLIICTYNPDPVLLKRALDSAQGFDEIIIIDDGSDIPVEGAIRIEHAGLGNARNVGISQAKGDIIALLDDDDYLTEPERMINFVNNFDSDIWHFTIQVEDGNVWGSQSVETIEQEDCIPGTSWFKKSVWEKVGGYKNIVAEDWVFWCEAKKKSCIFTYVPIIFYNYSLRADSLSHKNMNRLGEAREYINKL